MAHTPAPVSRAQSLAAWCALGLLAVVALGVWLKQAVYDPRAWGTPPEMAATGGAGLEGPLDMNALTAPGLTPMGAPEVFDNNTLSDKINGKAELYLSAGFVRLVTRRYALAADPAAWLEAYVFQMNDARGAYAVFSSQRRAEAKDSDLSGRAYVTGNALFLARGPYYLEVVASLPEARLLGAGEGWARAWLARAPEEAGAMGELALFPSEGLDKAGAALLAANVFGFDRLDQVFAAPYSIGGQEATAFVSRRADAAQADDLARAYVEFLLANGGQAVGAEAGPAGARLVEIMGTYEVVLTRGPLLAGVHGAESKALAESLGAALVKRLEEAK